MPPAFTFASFAADPLISSWAKNNKTKIVTGSIDTQGGTMIYVKAVLQTQYSPRIQANQYLVIKDVSKGLNRFLFFVSLAAFS